MDWVKPKHRDRRVKSNPSADADAESARQSAAQWLEQLCEENVALLQASLPFGSGPDKPRGKDFPISRYMGAMLWGTGEWDVSKPNSREFLHELVATVGSEDPSIDGVGKKGGRRKAPVPRSQEYRAQQIAHATKIGKWITQQLPKSSFDPYVALTCAGWLHALPEVGRDVSPSLWLEVLQSTLTQIDRAWEQGSQEELFPWIVWSCEVPLALAKQLSHLGGKDRIVSDTLNRIALVLEQVAENPQPLLAFGAQDLRAFVASLVRSRWAASGLGARKWYPPQQKALSKLALCMLYLSDGRGKSLLTDSDASRYDRDLWLSLLELCSPSKKLLNAAATALPNDVGMALGLKPAKMRKDKCLEAAMPAGSVYWEPNRIASMRRFWRDPNCRVAVDFSSDVIWLDITGSDGRRVFAGDWDVELKRDGEAVVIDVAWEEVCWFSDDDVDYLELECDLEGTCKIQRQLMLMRDEGMVFMADAIVSDTSALWEVESIWNLDPRVVCTQEAKTNEAWLQLPEERGGEASDSPLEAPTKRVGLVLPIGLPEWKRGNDQGELVSAGGVLRLKSSAHQCRLYNPLVVALNRLDREPAYTWRRLHVAQDLKHAPGEVALGYRVQIGKDQWVVYRSLAPCKRRSVMGLHLATEFYTGRFAPDDGSFEAMIEVNPA
jgi:hypothetical protein